MTYSIKKEIYQAILNCLGEYKVTELTSLEDVFFAKECHILGQPNPRAWLEHHELSLWEAIDTVNEWRQGNSWESLTSQELNPRTIVDLLVYGYASELLYKLTSFFDTVEELTVYLESEVGSGD